MYVIIKEQKETSMVLK